MKLPQIDVINTIQAQVTDIATLLLSEKYDEANKALIKLNSLLDTYRDIITDKGKK